MADVAEGGEIYGGQRICFIAVCLICNCKIGKEGIYRRKGFKEGCQDKYQGHQLG
jgi:hypothetical protein